MNNDFGNGSRGVLNITSGTTSLPMNTKLQYKSVYVGPNATIKPSGTTGAVLYIAAQESITIDGTINTTNVVDHGNNTWSVTIDGEGFTSPGTAPGGYSHYWTGQTRRDTEADTISGFGGGGSGHLYSASANYATRSRGAPGGASAGTGGAGGSAHTGTTSDRTLHVAGANGGNFSSGGGGGAYAVFKRTSGAVTGVAHGYTGGRGGSGYGANGANGANPAGAHSRASGSGGYSYAFESLGGGGAGGRAGRAGVTVVLKAPIVNVNGTINTSGTAGGKGGNGGRSRSHVGWMNSWGLPGSGGGGGRGGGVYIYFNESRTYDPDNFIREGGAGGAGGSGGVGNNSRGQTGSTGGFLGWGVYRVPPTPQFTSNVTTGEIPLTVSFVNQTLGGTTYSWDFGDGTTSTQVSPTKTYSELGTYTVSLTATNFAGTDTITKTAYITVNKFRLYGDIKADLKMGGSLETVWYRTAQIFADLKLSGSMTPRWRRGLTITPALRLGGSIHAVVSKNAKGIEDKKYLYKVYDEDGTYIETWNDVKDEPQFTHEINSLGSSMTVELARTSDSTQQQVEPLETESEVALQTESGLTIDAALTARNNIGPGTSIHHNNRVDVWAFYGNDGSGEDVILLLEDDSPILLEDDSYIILDSIDPIERRIFSGFISDINSRYGSTESTVVALSSYGWDLDQYLLTSGTNTTVTYNSYDPSDIAKDAIDKFVVTSADPDNLTYIHRTPNSIETTGTVVSYTFRNNTVAEVINKSLELMPSDWYYYVGLGDNIVYFSKRSETPDHMFTLGKHITSLDLRSYTGNSVNDVVFTGGGDPAMYKRYTAPRADRTRRTLSRLADSRVTVEQSAQIISEGTIERNNTMQYRTTLVVASKVYDIERIRVGDMVGFRNFGNYVDDLEFQIVGISYSPDTAQLQLSTLLPDVNQRLEDIRRNMLVEENKNIPNSPS